MPEDNSKLPTAIDESMYVPMAKYRAALSIIGELGEGVEGAANFMVGITLHKEIPEHIKLELNEKADTIYKLIEKVTD